MMFMNRTWENHEKLRSDLFKLIGITLCTPFCAIVLDQLVNGFNFAGDFIPRVMASLWLLKKGIPFLEEAIDISYILDKKVNSIC